MYINRDWNKIVSYIFSSYIEYARGACKVAAGQVSNTLFHNKIAPPEWSGDYV